MAHVYLAVSPDLPWAIHQGNPRRGSGEILEQQKQQASEGRKGYKHQNCCNSRMALSPRMKGSVG